MSNVNAVASYGDEPGADREVAVVDWDDRGALVCAPDGSLVEAKYLPLHAVELGRFLGVTVLPADPIVTVQWLGDGDQVPVMLDGAWDESEGADAIGWAFTASGETLPITEDFEIPSIHRGGFHRRDTTPPPWDLLLECDGWGPSATRSLTDNTTYWVHDDIDAELMVHTSGYLATEDGTHPFLEPGTAYSRQAYIARRDAYDKAVRLTGADTDTEVPRS